MNRRLLPTVALLVAGCATESGSSVTDAMTPQLVLGHESVDAAYVLAGAAIEHQGTLHLWTVTFSGEEGATPRVVHLTSPDARSWDADASAAALDGSAFGFDANGPVPSSVLLEDDGTWRLFGGGRLADGGPIVWTATAPGPDGPWSFHDTPILQPQRDGWDGSTTDHPSIVRTSNGYLMAYGGAAMGSPNRNRIGFARSLDGIRWERVPATLEGADDESALGPVACGIDARTMVEPELRVTDGGLRLDFGAIGVGADEMVIGSAESPDGSTWTCVSDGPIFEAVDVDGTRNLHSYVTVAVGGRESFLVELLAADSESSDLWLVDR